MLQRLSPWLAAGLTTGLVILFGIWLMALIYFNTFLLGYRSVVDQKMVNAVIETSIKNPDVQNALKNQLVVYFNSPDGKAKMTEILKSPEMRKVMSENIQSPEMRKAMSDSLQSPEMRAAIMKLMAVPEFRNAVLQIVKDTPEMRMLTLLSSAVTLDPPQSPSSPSPAMLK
ncbi:MAG: GerD family protein [Negativicutes bacterium]|nr:GerD family protein [Negativicutes bacterium]MDR3589944.1 GerD family protein [Negativicutes bacterium]